MTVPSVTPLPTAPSRSRPDTFATEADAFLGALDTFGTEINALGDAVETSTAAAAASEAAAATSEANAATSESNAATSETNAANSASAASGSASAAAGSAAAAAASFDQFDDIYLGAKSADPTTDNDGDPLQAGAIYFNTSLQQLFLYNGSAWTAAALDANGALLQVNNLSDLADSDVALTNLGLTATATELNYMDGVTSNVQAQLDSIDTTIGSLTKSFLVNETATITLSQSVSPTAVVAVTKEVPQTGVSSKGGWDVNATASNYEFYDEAPATSLTIATNSWTFSDATNYVKSSASFLAQDSVPQDLFFKPDGTKVYIVGATGDAVYEYDLSTAWDISTASYLQNFSVATEETNPSGLFFKPDGLKMYVVGTAGDDVNEYDLSTAWDVSTASYLQVFSVATEETVPTGIFFKPDGTKMYVIGSSGDDVNEYDLSTAWDVSTASYLQNFSVATEEAIPEGIFFKPDGTKMYVTGSSGDDVNEYDLSTAWDVSTATYLQNFSVATEETAPTGLFFKPDGTKMYVIGQSGRVIDEYDLGLVASLGAGSFLGSDIGKRIYVDDGGEGLLLSVNGLCKRLSDFGASSYTSGNWSLSGLDVDSTNGITISGQNSGRWEVNNSVYKKSFSVATETTSPSNIFFKPDGTKMYVSDAASGTAGVYEYDLSTAWDVSTASYLQNYDVSARQTSPVGLFFKPDGLRMYTCGPTEDEVNQYDLSTAWDVSTASYSGVFSVAGQDLAPQGIFFKTDGTRMYVVGDTGDDIGQYRLPSPWNITSAVFLGNFSVSTQETSPRDVYIRPDGLKMYVVGTTGDDVNEYDLSTAWDVSTATYVRVFAVGNQEGLPAGIFFKPDGSRMYVSGPSSDAVHQYDVGEYYQPENQYLPAITSSAGQIDSTYWTDINSMTADDVDNGDQVYYAVSTDDRSTWSIAKGSDGVRPIVRNNGGTWQYNSQITPTDYTWNLLTATYLQNFSVATEDTTPTDIFFKPDGTKMYILGSAGDDVNEYDLSTAWDVSTASYLQNFSVATEESNPEGLFFKPDGTKMYVIGSVGDDVNEYDLSTAWDVSTASYLQNFSVASQESNPQGIFFKPDGLKMYVTGSTGDDVNEYDLSTAWDVSTASYLQNFSVATEETFPEGIFFKSDGLKMYVIGNSGDTINEYDLSTAWDVSTASFTTGISVQLEEASPAGLFFKPDGTKMYVLGRAGDDVNEYDVSVEISDYAYSTSATWVNATINNEFSAVAEAMSLISNHMDKAQLDAVADGHHFVLGDTVDLAIILYRKQEDLLTPTSDGVSINYDAAVLNKGAILGTDYDYDVPENDKVRITSLATQNLKVRIV